MSAESDTSNATPAKDASRDEYLTFTLGTEDYGVDILRVREIRGWEAVTRVPNTPPYVQGVLNLRGTIVPVFDLRLRLGMPFRAYEKETVVIVIGVLSGNTEKNIGVIVDSVSDVLRASADDIQRAPDFGMRLNTDFIDGMVSAKEKMIMLLNVDNLKRFSGSSSDAE